jgi:hypothetical protein
MEILVAWPILRSSASVAEDRDPRSHQPMVGSGGLPKRRVLASDVRANESRMARAESSAPGSTQPGHSHVRDEAGLRDCANFLEKRWKVVHRGWMNIVTKKC